ncbi:Outer membrane protein assembly factor BamB, contains PQQ-like beta-propeller repeat [Micromonospora purpureochromogenes]|uniref:Outer membrane protein assembly factor BamB, contains PQQ-like beta-propeller repeat n=1 Tax=Micromonospora purpureochromogenes TaxID=47872 RepID=A0A1C4ZX41_9ACTN|nr:PQQ-binding-like beta-propeller repeat protein [Micromonospora purpureochromogenes]SCF37530.1 Outer membrane protein assembly factor BamB, contains PQQ-like beta-propeller repeat [Micromonospora purpureochromogenes]
MALIDLGDVREESAPEPPRRPPRTVGRPARVAATLVLTLVSLAAAAPVAAATSFTVPARSSTTAFLQDDRLFLLEPADAPAGRGGQLTAYAVPAAGDGPLAPLWRTPLPAAGTDGAVFVHRDVVLVTGGSLDGPRRAFAFDLDTGRLRWERPGHLAPAGDALLALENGSAEPGRVSSVDPATGRVGWSVATPAEATTYRVRPDGVDRIVASPSSGQVEVWDARTGARLRSADIHPGELPVYQRSQSVDELLLVLRDSAALVTAYGLDELDRRWEIRLGLVAYFAACGPLLCAYGQTGGMWALDRTTGNVRWRATRWHETLIEREGRMLVRGPGSGAQDSFAVLDTATGRTVADLGTWQVSGRYPAEDRPIGVRPADGDRLFVAELDVAGGRTRVLDVLAGVTGDCQADARLLLCRRSGGGFGIWRLDR